MLLLILKFCAQPIFWRVTNRLIQLKTINGLDAPERLRNLPPLEPLFF